MKTHNAILATILSTIIFTACDQNKVKHDSDVNLLIQQAKQSFNEINAVGFAWRDTEEMIKEAEIALVNDNTDEAISLAKEAIMQNKMAMIQYKTQKNPGPL